MGNSNDSVLKEMQSISRCEMAQFKHGHWEYVESLDKSMSYKYEDGFYHTYRHSINKELVDKYEVVKPNKEQFSFYVESFLWRMKEENIVNAVYL